MYPERLCRSGCRTGGAGADSHMKVRQRAKQHSLQAFIKIQTKSTGRLFGTHSALRLRRALRSTRTAAKKPAKAKPNTVFKEYFRRYCVGNPRQATVLDCGFLLVSTKIFPQKLLRTQNAVLHFERIVFDFRRLHARFARCRNFMHYL